MIKITYHRIQKFTLYLTLMIVFALFHNQPIRVSAETVGASLIATPTPSPATPTPEPIITSTPELTITPTPELTVTPTPELTITPIPEFTVTPTPELTVTPTPEPTKPPEKFIPDTLKLMEEYDYIGNSVTGISTKKVSVKTLQYNIKSLGKLYGTGMPLKEYKEAMCFQWEDVTEYNKKPSKISVDLTKTMNYDTYVKTLKMLSRYEGVYLYKIGKSTNGRDLYAIEIDVDSIKDKNVIMFTGQVHAREFAGGTYLVKQFVDLVQKAQTDKKTMELLKNNKYVAVPIINVDGREAIITEPSKWTSSGELWKAYSDGADGNRNFPGLQWGQVLSGYRLKWIIESRPAFANYPGSYAGSNNETKALMKWIYQYTVVEQASIYIDMHQQGSIVYAGKSWQTKQQESMSLNLRTEMLSFINRGIMHRKYSRASEETSYGLKGEGSSLTDYAVSLAIGAKFSPAYGFLSFTDGEKEYMLMEIRDLDKKLIKVKTANKYFAVNTVEIGYGSGYLGNSSNTRRLIANEYKNFNFDKLLEALPKMLD